MFENLKSHWAVYLKPLVLILVLTGMALPAKAEINHINTLDVAQARSKNLDDAYERQFNVATDMRFAKTAYLQSSCGAANGHSHHSRPSLHAAVSDYPT